MGQKSGSIPGLAAKEQNKLNFKNWSWAEAPNTDSTHAQANHFSTIILQNLVNMRI